MSRTEKRDVALTSSSASSSQQDKCFEVGPLTVDHTLTLELAKTYRDFARYYFTVRSNASYLNIVAAGAITYFFAERLIDNAKGDFVPFLTTNYWMYAIGCLAFVAFGIWATAICNLLSNSFFSYLIMVRNLESSLGVKYPKKDWAVTFEFMTEEAQEKMGARAVTGNVWNILNAFLTLYGIYALVIISYLAGQAVMTAVAITSFLVAFFFFALVAMPADLAAKNTFWTLFPRSIWLCLLGFVALNLYFALDLGEPFAIYLSATLGWLRSLVHH